ncbi:hypothetical protein HGM15179_011356, partial [Zosterops borbonicus]
MVGPKPAPSTQGESEILKESSGIIKTVLGEHEIICIFEGLFFQFLKHFCPGLRVLERGISSLKFSKVRISPPANINICKGAGDWLDKATCLLCYTFVPWCWMTLLLLLIHLNLE